MLKNIAFSVSREYDAHNLGGINKNYLYIIQIIPTCS